MLVELVENLVSALLSMDLDSHRPASALSAVALRRVQPTAIACLEFNEIPGYSSVKHHQTCVIVSRINFKLILPYSNLNYY